MDLLKSGIINRKLTRKEAAMVIREVVESGIKDPDLRFSLIIIKTMEIVDKPPDSCTKCGRAF